MAWIEPKTDWSEDDRCTYADLNRIGENILELDPTASVKTDFTQNDYLTKSQWSAVISSLRTMTLSLRISAILPTMEMTAQNFNAAENVTKMIKDRLDLLFRQKSSNIYVGEGIYTAAAGAYPNTAENYLRGV